MAASEDVVSAAQDSTTQNYLHLLSMTMLCYDQLLTLPAEIAYIWTRPRSVSSILFLLNRYLAFTRNIVFAAVTFTRFPPEDCPAYSLGSQIILIVNEVVVCVILTLRVYALYQRSRRVLAFLLATGLLTLGLGGWALTSQKNTVFKQVYTGCHMANTRKSDLAIPWEMLFVTDCIIFALTLRATYTAHQQHRGITLNGRLPLVSLLLRDGCLSTFASNFSVLLVSRLMLNMHKYASPGILTTNFWSEGTNYRTPLVFLERTERAAPGEQAAHTEMVRVGPDT
ncbi:hypothetical protein PLICRDRAFT_58408 [Plicaturopsis crispa FD-325 SS-3]|uniref:DUF6533 domain-containing protein n=1 Tax=Plicaturopsis crispa FD-325 SS-3 TaxID=944288 RepID=A0A0C9SK92_PLICR|nr:hypothetical protein PLICRDRAFT_58408 [Plicaturopsis crispa FD-325 SS-3]